jgi:hypothetical protein
VRLIYKVSAAVAISPPLVLRMSVRCS